MNIYTFEGSQGETDWVFAPNMKEAKEFYLNHTGCGDLINMKVDRMPKSKWNETYLLDPNEDDPDGGLKKIESFAEYAERNTTTDMIATTEY